MGALKLKYYSKLKVLDDTPSFFSMPLNEKGTAKIFRLNSYRYGFQGQEKDDEIKGEGNSLNYKYRMHDARIGRFFAVDPLTSKYPHYTPYSFSGNRLIDAHELEGLEPESVQVNYLSADGSLESSSYVDANDAGGMGFDQFDNLFGGQGMLNELNLKNTDFEPGSFATINVQKGENGKYSLEGTSQQTMAEVTGQKINKTKETSQPLSWYQNGGAGPIGGVIRLFSEQAYIDMVKYDAHFEGTTEGMQDGILLFGAVVGTILGGEAILAGRAAWYTYGAFAYNLDGLTKGNDGVTIGQNLALNIGGEKALVVYNVVGIAFTMTDMVSTTMGVSFKLADGRTVSGVVDVATGVTTIIGTADTIESMGPNQNE